MIVTTELQDIVFTGKAGEQSLASLGLHVERQGLTSLFALPTYNFINAVDWQEYDGVDVDFSSASLNPVSMEIKVFGSRANIETLIAKLKESSKTGDIEVAVKIKEDNNNNAITFNTKFVKATQGKAVIENEWRLEYFLLTDQDTNHILNEDDLELEAGIMEKQWRQITFVTLSFIRYNNSGYFGLLADNTRACIGIPNARFVTAKYPKSNMPFQFRRYSMSNRNASLVSSFDLYDTLVFCYPLKGVVAGVTNYAESKTAYQVQTEGMTGEVYHTKNIDKRKAKTITLPILIRSHSVSAIFSFLGKYKTFVHNTITANDMLYLHSDTWGDFAVYPTGCTVSKAYLNNQPWVEMTLQFCAYKEGFDFSADTDNVANDNPEPVLPPAPPAGFDPYTGIDKTRWIACSFHTSMKAYEFNYCCLVSMRDPENHDGMHYPYNNYDWMLAGNGWSCYSTTVNRYPVGTLFFAQRNWYMDNGTKVYLYNTMICLPWCVKNLETALSMYSGDANSYGWNNNRMTLVGVVQGCDVLSKTIKNWTVELQDAPKYGGLVGRGSVRVHSDVMALKTANKFDVANNLVLSSSDDFDLLVDNIIEEFEADPMASGYYTETGYNDRNKVIV